MQPQLYYETGFPDRINAGILDRKGEIGDKADVVQIIQAFPADKSKRGLVRLKSTACW